MLAIAVMAAALFAPTGALAKPRPVVSLAFTNASAGAPISFSWSARRLGHGTHLALQRPVGTARVWKNVMRLNGRSGSGQLPGQPLGTYRYRVAALRGRWVLAQQVASVSVFGQVPFSVLFRESSNGGVYATPSTSFPYVRYALLGTEESFTAFSVSKNHCSAVHIGFVPGEYVWSTVEMPRYTASTGTITVTQQSRDPVSSTVPFNGTGSVDVELVPGQTWSVLASDHGEANFLHIYYNGYAICDSAEPFGS
jgi:hypothetical protein